jgi:hypothetical protein
MRVRLTMDKEGCIAEISRKLQNEDRKALQHCMGYSPQNDQFFRERLVEKL